MSGLLGHINKTVPFSVVDGPGSRFVIFLQGCNFDCIACHNPYTINECDSCGVCVDQCPEGALDLLAGPLVVLDEPACTECDICIAVCPSDSTPLSAWRSVPDILDEIRPVAGLIRGITVSGGEATQQPDFLMDLFSSIRGDADLAHLTILVDSNGTASDETWERLIPLIDGAMIDLKALDPEIHHLLTARPNDQVLRSIDLLFAAGKLEEVRVLIMPGYNTDPDEVAATGAWLEEHCPGTPLKLITFRHHGVRSEGLHVPVPTAEQMEDARRAFARAGDRPLMVV